MLNSPSVLVCPLDWGIGHATRCVPVIRKFQAEGYRVILAADGRALDFLQKEFPECRSIRFPGTRIRYTTGRMFALKMLFISPLLLIGILREHAELKKIIRSEKPDIIFSDNRYGLWSKDVRCIFMTHQLNVLVPGVFMILSGLVNRTLHFFIRKFDECWVPDLTESPGFAGTLSHPSKITFPVHYIGLLSRFDPEGHENFKSNESKLDFMAILSGPEPQRSIFEEMIFDGARVSGLNGVIVRGRTEETDAWDLTEKIRVFSHLNTQKMEEFIRSSKVIICRSGYSGIMDLVTLGKSAVLVPTPGQTEQEYLAIHLAENKMFCSMSQENFDFLKAIKMSFIGLETGITSNSSQLLDKRIKAVMDLTGLNSNTNLNNETG